MTVEHDRIDVRREYPAPVDRVFANWADPRLKQRWFCEAGNEYESDFRIGGIEVNRARRPGGSDITYVGRYSDIVPGERIVSTYELFSGDVLMSVSLVTVAFAPAPAGTALTLVEQIVLLDDRDRAEYRRSGINTHLDRLGATLEGLFPDSGDRMNITNVLAGVAVKDLDEAKRWYETFFGRPADAEPMPGLAEWHTPGGVVQLVADEQRAGGSLVTVWVRDARQALTDLADRGGTSTELDTTTSDKVLFTTILDADGNGITVVEVRDDAGSD